MTHLRIARCIVNYYDLGTLIRVKEGIVYCHPCGAEVPGSYESHTLEDKVYNLEFLAWKNGTEVNVEKMPTVTKYYEMHTHDYI